jgi:hypothetical protein
MRDLDDIWFTVHGVEFTGAAVMIISLVIVGGLMASLMAVMTFTRHPGITLGHRIAYALLSALLFLCISPLAYILVRDVSAAALYA